MTSNSRAARFARTERINNARLVDPATAQIEEMALARELLTSEDVNAEVYLSTTAYLDYRYKTPYQRTQDFMRKYQKWYANKQAHRGGRSRWMRWGNLSMCRDRDFTCFWRARQHADLLGVPYDRYILSVMNRDIERGTTELPAPNQLYSDGLARYVEKELAPLRKSGTIGLLPLDCNPRFFAENFIGDSVQLAALDAIEADVRDAGKVNQVGKLHYYMRQRRLISEHEARRRLGDAMVDAALSERPPSIERPWQPLATQDVACPGCFGCHQSSSPVCSSCPFAVQCVERARQVDGLLLERHGTLDVRALRVRAGNRKRKKRQRERARAGATMTLQEEKRLIRELGNPKLKEKRLKAKVRRDDRRRKEQEVSAPVVEGAKPDPQPQPEPQPQPQG